MPELPKLSAFVKNLTVPEKEFENFVKGVGIELPRGPLSTLTMFLESFEKGETVKPPKLPPLPTLTTALPEEEEMRPTVMEEEEMVPEEFSKGEIEEMMEFEEERGKGRVY